MMLRHGYSLIVTLIMTLSLAGCFGGGGTSKADKGAGDRSTDTATNPEEVLTLTKDFSVEAGPSIIFIDGGGEVDLTGTVSHPDDVTITQTYWRIFDGGFSRIDGTLADSDADNIYEFQTDRRLGDSIYTYQFVALDSLGRAAVDTVYVRVGAYPVSIAATLASEEVSEGGSFNLVIELDQPLSEDFTTEFELQSGTAIVGTDVEDCTPCSLTIPAGAQNVVISLNAISDEIEESDETFSVVFPALEALLGEASTVELTILDQEDLRPIVSFVQTNMMTAEDVGSLDIALQIEFPDCFDIYTESIDEVSSLEPDILNESGVTSLVETRAAPGEAPVLQASYAGTATADEDYVATEEITICGVSGDEPRFHLQVNDDAESEGAETIIITLEENEFYRIGEVNRITIELLSDDVSHMASAENAYCTVQDQVGIRCWGDYVFGKTETPALGVVEKLAGAGDYFCAIHSNDGVRLLDCWGDVPGGSVVGRAAPDDILALNDEWCEHTQNQSVVECHNYEGNVQLDSQLLLGSFNTRCVVGAEQSVDCGRAQFSAEVLSLALFVDELLYAEADFGDGGPTIGCVRTDTDVICDGIELPDFESPVAMEVINTGDSVGVCVIDQLAAGNELVCIGGDSQSFAPFEGLTMPYQLTSDFDGHLCVADLNDVHCVTYQNNTLNLLSVDALAVTDIATGSFNRESEDLCGLQDGSLVCDESGRRLYDRYTFDSGSAALALDMESDQPSVLFEGGSVSYFYPGEGLFQSVAEFNAPLAEARLFAKGDGFVCALTINGVECYDHGQTGIAQSLSGSSVTQLDANNYETCGIVEGSLACWSESSEPEVRFDAAVSEIIDLDMSGDSGCAVTAQNQFTCWGNVSELYSEPQSFAVGEFQDIKISDERICLLGSNGVQCWYDGELQRSEINGESITDLVVTDRYACVLEDARVRCWGDYPNFGGVALAAQ